jgi:hypothetical protein
MPNGLDQPIRSLAAAKAQLATATSQSGRLYFCAALIILGLGCLAVSFPVIGTLSHSRRSVIVADVLAGLACVSGVVVNSLVNLNVAGAVRADASPDAAAQVLFTVNTTFLPTAFLTAYIGGLIAASILMAVALWRAVAVPRWLAALFPVGLVLGSVAPPGLVGAALSLPFAAVMILLTVRLWRGDTHYRGSASRTDAKTTAMPAQH